MATHQIAKGIAQLGRNGDSMLMHVQPEEVAGLQALAKSKGTSLTINPETGLPEAFNLGGFFKSLLPVLAGAATGGAGAPLWAGIAAGAATGAVTNRKDPLMGAVMGGMGGYGGYNLGSSIGAMSGSGPTAANVAANPQGYANAAGMNAASNEAAAAVAKGNIPSTLGNSIDDSIAFMNRGVDPVVSQALNTSGANIADPLVQDTMRQAQQSAIPYQQNLSNTLSNAKDLATFQPGAWDAYTAAGGSAMQMGMPLGGAVLGGLEPSDLGFGTNLAGSNPKDKYDPYASLNLSGDTGLRLYAMGGPVSFADGGDSNKEPAGLPGGGLGALAGGDAGAMQGAGMLPLDVSDINAKYGLGEEASFVPAPRLGLFADNDQIEAARTAYETQLASAMSGRGGMGSPFGYGSFNRMSGGMSGMGQPTQVRGMGGLQNPNGGQNSMGMMTRTTGGSGMGATAPTAGTAETALSRLNLNKTYADGGTIQSGGLQDLYATSDNPTMNPSLSRDGYGLGRLQQLADGGVAGYAEGGETRYTLDKNTLGGRMFGDTGVIDQLPPSALAQLLNNPGMRHFMGLRAVEEPKYYTASGAGMGGGDALNLGRSTGVNLNTPSGLGMAKGGYLDGPGDGMSDSIPATIEGKQPARLADGEFVIPADVVSHLGNGSTKAGSQRLYGMLDKVRKARTGTKKQGKQINPEKYMPA